MKNPLFRAMARFSDNLIHCNQLESQGFASWLFHPGMLTGADQQWWDECNRRQVLHEGLDLCWYRTG
ncbi:hypothetical protein ACFL6N_02390 [Thermodesulfobacteriota bacterium]